VIKLNATTYRIAAAAGHAIVRKDENGRWTAKAYAKGELHRDLGSFKTRREAGDTASYHLDFEVK
jgi:hypothetical protein